MVDFKSLGVGVQPQARAPIIGLDSDTPQTILEEEDEEERAAAEPKEALELPKKGHPSRMLRARAANARNRKPASLWQKTAVPLAAAAAFVPPDAAAPVAAPATTPAAEAPVARAAPEEASGQSSAGAAVDGDGRRSSVGAAVDGSTAEDQGSGRKSFMGRLGLPDLPRFGSVELDASNAPAARRSFMSMLGLPDLPKFGDGETAPTFGDGGGEAGVAGAGRGAAVECGPNPPMEKGVRFLEAPKVYLRGASCDEEVEEAWVSLVAGWSPPEVLPGCDRAAWPMDALLFTAELWELPPPAEGHAVGQPVHGPPTRCYRLDADCYKAEPPSDARPGATSSPLSSARTYEFLAHAWPLKVAHSYFVVVSAFATPSSGRGVALRGVSERSHALTMPALEARADGSSRSSVGGTVHLPPVPPTVRVATVGLVGDVSSPDSAHGD